MQTRSLIAFFLFGSFEHIRLTSCPVSSLQVHVGTSHQEQRVVGYLTCTHLHAIEGNVASGLSVATEHRCVSDLHGRVFSVKRKTFQLHVPLPVLMLG